MALPVASAPPQECPPVRISLVMDIWTRIQIVVVAIGLLGVAINEAVKR